MLFADMDKILQAAIGTAIIACAFALSGCPASISQTVDLQVAPGSVSVFPGGSSQTLIISNAGKQAAQNLAISSSLSDVTIIDSCANIAAGASCSVLVYAPANSNPAMGTLSISGANFPMFSVPLSVSLQANSALAIDQSSLVIYQGTPSTLTVKNTGNVALSGIALNGLPGAVTESGGCTSLATGASCTFNLNTNARSGVYPVTVSADEMNAVPLDIYIGASTPVSYKASLSVTPGSILVAPGTVASLLLTNTDSVNAIIGMPSVNASQFNSGDLSATPDSSCLGLLAGASCTIKVSASANSPQYAAVPVSISVLNSTNSVQVPITVTAPAIFLNASTFAMAPGSANQLNITVHNGSEVAVNNIAIQEDTLGLPGALPTGLSEVSTTCPGSSGILSAGNSCVITLQADPVSSSTTYDLEITSSGGVAPLSVTVAPVSIATADANSIVYLPENGTVLLSVTNSSSQIAQTITIPSGELPSGVQATSCNAPANSSCELTLTATNASATPSPVPITIAGNNTTNIHSLLSVEAPIISLSAAAITFNGPSSQFITVTNNSHFPVSGLAITPPASSTGIVVSNNNCTGTLAPIHDASMPSQCSFTLQALANALTPDNTALAANGLVTFSAGSTELLSAGSTVSAAAANVILNNAQPIVIPSEQGAQTSVPVQVAAGSFDAQDLTPDLLINGATAPTTLTLIDSNDPTSPCPNPLTAGSNCAILIQNTTALDSNGSGKLTLNYDGSLTAAVSQTVTVDNGVAMSYVSAKDTTNYNSYYASAIQGPKYGVVLVHDQAVSSDVDPNFTISAINLSQAGSSVSIVPRSNAASDPYYGTYPECSTTAATGLLTQLTINSPTCLIVLSTAIGNPTQAPQTASLSISASNSAFTSSRTFNLTNNTYLYIGAYGNGNAVLRYNYSANAWTPISTTLPVRVWALAVDNRGNVYTAAPGGVGIYKNDPLSGWQAVGGGAWPSSVSAAYSLTFDGNNNLYVGGLSPNFNVAVTKYSPSTAWQVFNAPTPNWVQTVFFDSLHNVLYAGVGMNGALQRFNLNNPSLGWQIAGSSIPTDVDAFGVDSNGVVYSGAMSGLGTVEVYNAQQDSWALLTGGTGLPQGVNSIAIDANNDVFAGLSSYVTAYSVYEYSNRGWQPGGGTMNQGAVLGLLFDGSGNLYASSLSAINKYSVSTGWQILGGINYSIPYTGLGIGTVLQVAPQ